MERKVICCPVLALILVACLSFAFAAGEPAGTFTIEADRITMRCTSNLLELLGGHIKAENVTMENVRVSYGGRTMTFSSGRCGTMELKVTFLSVLGVAITNLADLIPMLLGKTVTLEDVKMKAYWVKMDYLIFQELEVRA